MTKPINDWLLFLNFLSLYIEGTVFNHIPWLWIIPRMANRQEVEEYI